MRPSSNPLMLKWLIAAALAAAVIGNFGMAADPEDCQTQTEKPPSCLSTKERMKAEAAKLQKNIDIEKEKQDQAHSASADALPAQIAASDKAWQEDMERTLVKNGVRKMEAREERDVQSAVGVLPALKWASPFGPPIIAIRYVASVDMPAKPIWERVSSANPSLAATNYYAAQLRQRLKEQIPQAQILLDPANLTLDSEGHLAWATGMVRSSPDVLIDFVAWIPNGADPTAIRRVKPIASIMVAPKMAPTTQGLVATTKNYEWIVAKSTLGLSPYDALGASLIEGFQRSSGTQALGAKGYSEQGPWIATKAILLKSDYVEAKNDVFPKSLDVYGFLVADALNTVSAQNNRILDPDFAAYYDPSFAKTTENLFVGSAPKPQQGALQKIRQAEAGFLNTKSEAIAKVILYSDFGNSFRATRDAQDQAAHQAMISGIFAALTMAVDVAGQASTIRSSPSTSQSYGNKAINDASNYIQERKTYMDSLSTAMSPAVNLQVAVALKIDEESNNVSAVSLAELRGKLRALYQRKFAQAN
jgi:hypothetical protein